ncbi:MAG: MBL fold metallo-hydrolase [Alphaproteobacteria bacterium]
MSDPITCCETEQEPDAYRARPEVRIRMYRVGVGDCFLLSYAKQCGGTFHMLIDCGVHQSTKGGSDRIRQVVDNIKEETGGKFDVVVGTHEHWDHISGFRQAEETFATCTAEEIWFAWTEDDRDEDAKDLADRRHLAIAALTGAQQRMRLNGLDRDERLLSGLLGFFGDGAGKNLAKAGKALKAMSSNIKYRQPGEPPIELPGVCARVFVLGPPRDKTLMKKDSPSKRDSEVYEFGAYGNQLAALAPALESGNATPFDQSRSVPLEASRGIGFFDRHYWSDRSAEAPQGDREDTTQGWRRLGADWLTAATTLALHLDEDTNNTSLVMAIELGPPDEDGPVLLFAADAQVGNWLSWQDVEWPDYHGRRITGPDLLRRTVVYKVGHHASHNATLRELGLEQMDKLALALVTTDDEMAKKVGWGTLPWPALLDRLDEKTGGNVLRTDRKKPAGLDSFEVVEDELYYDVFL